MTHGTVSRLHRTVLLYVCTGHFLASFCEQKQLSRGGAFRMGKHRPGSQLTVVQYGKMVENRAEQSKPPVKSEHSNNNNDLSPSQTAVSFGGPQLRYLFKVPRRRRRQRGSGPLRTWPVLLHR